MTLDRFPHCDQRILHGPDDGCQFCNEHPEWQALREAWGIAFTGHTPRGWLPTCGLPIPNSDPGVICLQPLGHNSPHMPMPAWDILPCPADFARPQDLPSDHRRWPGNRPGGYT